MIAVLGAGSMLSTRELVRDINSENLDLVYRLIERDITANRSAARLPSIIMACSNCSSPSIARAPCPEIHLQRAG